VGTDARELLQRLDARFPGGTLPAQAQILRTILVQHFLVDGRGRFRPRTKHDGQPPSRVQIESPYETAARFTRRGDTRWTGYLAHVTETCDDKRINVITDVATVVSSADSQALPGIHARLRRLRLLPGQHLVDGGYTSVAGMDAAARLHRVTLIGPLPASTSPQHRAQDGFGRENFVIDFDQREVTCPNGQVSGNWQDLPVAEPTSVTVRFDARQCGRCPEQAACTPGPFRSLYFPTRRLHELQAKNRADQQDADWRRLYGLRSGPLRHHRGVRAQPSRTPMPLPRPGQDARPARPDRTRNQRRTAQPPRTRRLHPPAPPTHGIPAVPRRTQPAPPPVVAPRQMTPELKIPDRVTQWSSEGIIRKTGRALYTLAGHASMPLTSAGTA
jgi:hypothetical protein